MTNICVFCSSSHKIDEIYINAAEELGRLIGKQGHTLIYGGSHLGLMGVLAKSVQKNGGKVIGVIPEHLGSLAQGEDEIIKAKNMFHRKEIMEMKSDAFIALPGGIGTIDEIFDILVGIQLKIHSKPLTIINTNNYFDDLIKQLNKIDLEGFSTLKFDIVQINNLFTISKTPKQALDNVLKNLSSHQV